MSTITYTHRDKMGMRWRFVGSRPVSELADKVMMTVAGYAIPKPKPKKKGTTKRK